jgi:hypothetical protein
MHKKRSESQGNEANHSRKTLEIVTFMAQDGQEEKKENNARRY